MNNDITSAAINYLGIDLSVVPVGENKRPPIKWETFQRKAVDSSECERLFGNSWGIAIIAGSVSDGVEFIDFDAHGKDIQPIFDAFMLNEQARLIFLKHEIYIEKSKSGGYHIVYKYDCDGKRDGSMKLATWSNGESMIETRGDRGYCIVFPTPGYVPLQGSIEELPRLSDVERDYLIDLCKSFTQTDTPAETEKESKDTKSKAIHDNTDPVSWFNWHKDNYAKKILEEKGWKKLKYDEKQEIEYWQRPGKDTGDDSWSATWGKKSGALYIFTQSVDYFKEKAYYTPFQILVKLKFDNDYVAATKWIVSKYDKHKAPPEELIEKPVDQSKSSSSFPVGVFPPEIQQFIKLLNESLNYSQDFLSIAIMFVMATLNGNKFKLKVKNGWNAPTVFWFAAVGEPGTMKSHPISTIIDPIEDIDRESKRLYDIEYSDYERELVESKNKKLIRKPKFRQIRITDITLESLHEIHSINKRGLGYYKDELVGFINSMDQYRKGADVQFWLESYNNKSYIVNRVSKQVNLIEDTNINVIGTIQPNVLSRITKNFDGNGLTDRFLYTSSEENIYPLSDVEINPKWFEWWNQKVKTAHNSCQYLDKNDTVILEMSPEAKKKMIEIDVRVCATQKSEDISESLKNYLSKSKTYLPRFTLLMAIIDWLFIANHELEVTVSHVERADQIMQYFVESSKNIFSKSEKDTEISEVASVKKGSTTPEMIVYLHDKGYKNSEIARRVNKSRAYIGQVLNPPKKK